MENKTAYLRAYLAKPSIEEGEEGRKLLRPPITFSNQKVEYKRVFVFDTETTTDIYQNLIFGSFLIVDNKKEVTKGLFYADTLPDTQEGFYNELKKYSEKYKINLMSAQEFLDNYFFPECYDKETPCIGFNPAFDLSRIANGCVNNETKKPKKEPIKLSYSGKNGEFFGIQIQRFGLGEKITWYARKHLVDTIIKDKKTGAVKVGKRWKNVTNEEGRKKGVFLDVGHLFSVLYGSGTEKFSLEYVSKKLGVENPKTKVEVHGIVTEDYIDYNINDVRATYECFLKIMEYKDFMGVKTLRPEEIYSSASLGKHLYKEMNFTPFLEKNPNYPKERLGQIYSSFYAGRVECAYRHEAIPAEALDFTSEYPTVVELLGLMEFMRTDGYKEVDKTEEIRELVENITIDDFEGEEGRKIWRRFRCLVKINPKNDFLPIRTNYNNSAERTVAIQMIKGSDVPLYYALPDVIASKLITGKSPEILEGIEFIPNPPCKNLSKTSIFGLEIDPKKVNLHKFLVEKRAEIKREGGEGVNADIAQGLKITVNATSFGIYIEQNTVDEETDMEVYAGDSHFIAYGKSEKDGKWLNPFIGNMITAGGRLLLALAQKKAIDLGHPHYYMDTDSIFVSPKIVKPLMVFFNSFNPYDNIKDLLKLENDKLKTRYGEKITRKIGEDGLYHPTQYFMGIASKRYVLFAKDENGEPDVDAMEGKLHGLGHIMRLFENLETEEDKKIGRKVTEWHHFFWQDIINYIEGNLSQDDVERIYGGKREVSKMSIRTSIVLSHFREFNKGKPWEEQIKPYNFFLKANSDQDNVIPILPMRDNVKEIEKTPFINRRNGLPMQGEEYFKRMDKTFIHYAEHKEKKFKGNEGYLERREIFINNTEGIGKEIDTNKEFEGENTEIEPPGGLLPLTVESVREELEKVKKDKSLRVRDIEKIELELEKDNLPAEDLKRIMDKIKRKTRFATREPLFLTEEQKEDILNLSEKEGRKLGLSKSSLMRIKRSLRKGENLNKNIGSTQLIMKYLNNKYEVGL